MVAKASKKHVRSRRSPKKAARSSGSRPKVKPRSCRETSSAFHVPDPTQEPGFVERVRLYVEASKIAPEMALPMAETIVGAELHERLLLTKLTTEGLSDDQHRVLGGVRSNLLRLRKALGVLEPKKAESSGFLGDDVGP